MSEPEQDILFKGISEKRFPVTAAQCAFRVILYCAYGCALVYFALHHSGWPLFLSCLLAFVQCLQVIVWFQCLRLIRRGNQAEYVFAPVEERESFKDIFMERFSWTLIAVSIAMTSLHMLRSGGHFPSFAVIGTALLMNLAAWRQAYHVWMRDRAYKSEPKVKFASHEDRSGRAGESTRKSAKGAGRGRGKRGKTRRALVDRHAVA